ncbi:hypothetical protein GCM10022226_59410 [Sphaerisporangium flaviroseum]|uniref:FtsX extracellular domain-containing protein n=1 Tax=Sphaerisporangium flaviroseum TaxID=509199 RepID=A0ABP7IZ09_9ACTN
MDRSEEPPSAEELSFGGDTDREERASAHRGPLALGVAALVLLGVLGGGAWYLRDQSRRPLPPPDTPVPEQLNFQVAICDEGIARCQTDDGRVIGDAPRIEAALRAIPEIASVRFVSARSTYQRWRDSPDRAPGPDTGFTLTWADFINTFDGTLRRSADYPAVAAKVMTIPGVQDITRKPTDFWAGKADATVILCGRGVARVCESIAGRQATDEQKQAIVDRIHDVDGVEKIYFEDRAHALMLRQRSHPEGTAGEPTPLLDQMRESFRVKTSTPEAAEAVRNAVKELPGVECVE